MTTSLAALLGLGAGAGLLLIIVGWRPRPRRPVRPRDWLPAVDQRVLVRATAAGAVAVLTVIVTSWLVGGVLAGIATWWLPRLLGRSREHEERVGRIEAIASWTEMLRDTLAAAAGLEQAITATAPIAPEPIRAEIGVLSARVEAGHRLAPSLRQLAADLDDPNGDLVVAALSQAAQRQASRLGELLSTLAHAARDQAAMRLRVEANRARTRTSIRVIVATTLGFAVGLVLLNRDYLAAFDSALGQLVLLGVGALFAAGFAWLSRIGHVGQPARLFSPTSETTATITGRIS